MFLAEFAYTGTTQLAEELLIQAPSKVEAQDFAQQHATNWGLEVFSLHQADERQVRLYQLMGKVAKLGER